MMTREDGSDGSANERDNTGVHDTHASHDQRVRWHLFSGINDFDLHTPHWHGAPGFTPPRKKPFAATGSPVIPKCRHLPADRPFAGKPSFVR